MMHAMWLSRYAESTGIAAWLVRRCGPCLPVTATAFACRRGKIAANPDFELRRFPQPPFRTLQREYAR